MENPQPIASTESFSYSWLVGINPNYSPQNSHENEQNFNFNLPITINSIVHADEIFSDGHIMPVYTINRSKLESLQKSSTFSVPQSPVSSFISHKKAHFFPRKWRTTKRILQKYLGFVNPFVGFSRKNSRVDDLERKVCEVESVGNSGQASPRRSASDFGYGKSDIYYGLRKARSWNITTPSPVASPRISSSHNSSFCCDVDQSSIHEAILYCKRSIEK